MPIDNNFYKKLKQLCDERGVKPTPVVKSLGISATNLKRWENGATVNSDILNKIADYFQVPVDFFFDAENDEETFDPIENETSFKDVFNVAKAHSDYIVSFLFRKTVYDHDLNKIADYIGCKKEYLILNQSIINKNDIRSDVHTPVFLISEILSCIPLSKEYRFLQVRISRIITRNLEKQEIDDDILKKKVGLVHKKIDRLNDKTISDEKKKGLNYSDVINIARKLNVSFEYMLTGKGEVGYSAENEVFYL